MSAFCSLCGQSPRFGHQRVLLTLMMSAFRSGNHTHSATRWAADAHDVGIQVEELATRRAADAHDVGNHSDLATRGAADAHDVGVQVRQSHPFGHKVGHKVGC